MYIIRKFQAFTSRRFRIGFHRGNLHRPTMPAMKARARGVGPTAGIAMKLTLCAMRAYMKPVT